MSNSAVSNNLFTNFHNENNYIMFSRNMMEKTKKINNNEYRLFISLVGSIFEKPYRTSKLFNSTDQLSHISGIPRKPILKLITTLQKKGLITFEKRGRGLFIQLMFPWPCNEKKGGFLRIPKTLFKIISLGSFPTRFFKVFIDFLHRSGNTFNKGFSVHLKTIAINLKISRTTVHKYFNQFRELSLIQEDRELTLVNKKKQLRLISPQKTPKIEHRKVPKLNTKIQKASNF